MQISGSIRGTARRVCAVGRGTSERLLLCVGLLIGCQAGAAETVDSHTVLQRPVWEIGVAGGLYAGHDYPASNDENRRALALPFFVYRGPQWRLGGGGVRAVAIEQPRLRLDLSLGGSLNASSAGNRAREGMPDLDFLFEFGPQLELSLLQRRLAQGGLLQVRFTTELRAVLSTDFQRVDGRGAVVEAGLGLNWRNVRHSGIDLLAGIRSTFASERLQDYFYEVAPEYVSESRRAFDARGGYLETAGFVGIGVSPVRDLRVFAGLFTGWFEGARNRDSPLFETEASTGFALGLVWTLKRSERLVEVVELGEGL